ncbi:insulin-like growth factor-binding protein 5 [Lethenteron reissneri]|nr:insulin-like growth factor-binding protein 5 [Lethenteron reissneri]
MEGVIKLFKETTLLNPKGIYIPNCDRKGFYKRKQCNPSKGRKRGLCWCVDRYGAHIPGSEHVGGSQKCLGVVERD